MAGLLVVEDAPGELITSAPFYRLAGIAGADDPIYVKSVPEMVSKLWSRAMGIYNPQLRVPGIGVIDTLFIGGHGSSGDQSVGSGSGSDLTGTKCLRGGGGTLGGVAASVLPALTPLFSPGAVVTLGGCEVADGVKGRNLLMAVSKALGGIVVQGATGYQFTMLGHLRGDVWRARGGSVQNLGEWASIPGSTATPPKPNLGAADIAAVSGTSRTR
jgi:hypothetical protein